MIPMQTGDSVTGVSLKIVRGKKKKGLVDIFLDGEKAGKITGVFSGKIRTVFIWNICDRQKKIPQSRSKKHVRELRMPCRNRQISMLHIHPDLSLSQFEMCRNWGGRSEMKEENAN